MGFKKSLRIKGQSVIEYTLLVVIAIVALLITNFVVRARENAFEEHFQNAAYWIGGVNP